MSINRLSGLDVSVFSVGGTSFIDDLENATVSVENAGEDARAIKDRWSYEWITGQSWTLEADVYVGASAAIFAKAASDDASVDISFTTGGNAYAGTGVITSSNHQSNRGALQMQKVTIKGQGALTVTAP